MKRPLFQFALATLTTCGVAGFAISAARAQSTFGNGRSIFGGPGRPSVSRFDNTGMLSRPPGELQYGGVNNPYGTPGPYEPYSGNSSVIGSYGAGLGPNFGNYGGGYSNAGAGYGGYNPYYGDGVGYGVNYGGVNSGSYGYYVAPAYYWNGSYSNGIYWNGYYGGANSSTDLGYRGYSPYLGNNAGYGVNYEAVNSGSYGNYASPAYYGGGYYSKGISGKGYSP
jgi:hypothetical protein